MSDSGPLSTPPDWSARDMEILAENVAMVRKFGLDHIERAEARTHG